MTRFFDICLEYHFDYDMLRNISEVADVPLDTGYKMFMDIPVNREHAEAVLALVAKNTHQNYTLHTVAVPICDQSSAIEMLARTAREGDYARPTAE